MTGSRLAALLDQATPGPWEHWEDGDSEGFYAGERGRGYTVNMGAQYADARLIALAPDLARLVIQAVERHPEDKWLLARFAALDEKAGGA